MAAGLDLGKQVGPLPLGGWLVVVGGGLGIGYYMNKRQSAADNTPADTSTQQLTESDTGEGGAQYVYTPPVPVTGPSDDTIETNDEWSRQIVNWLTGVMGVAGTTAQQTVTKYLDGQTLSATELAQMNLAIGHFGAPPEPLPPSSQPPVTDPGTTTGGKPSPPAVSNLHVATAKGINSVGWTYKGDATSFAIRAIIIGTNSSVSASVMAIPDGQTHNYGWQHIAGGSIRVAHTYDYRVIPMKGSVAGDQRTKRATLRP